MTHPSPIVRLPLPAMTAVIAGLTVVALVLAVKFPAWGLWRFAFFAIPAIVAVYYLNEYRKLPFVPYHFWPLPAETPAPVSGGATAADASAEEPFEDPVEEADRMAAESETPTPTEGDQSPPANETSSPAHPP